MADRDTRAIERRAQQGDGYTQAKLLQRRLHAGEIRRFEVEVLAWAGDLVAQRVLGISRIEEILYSGPIAPWVEWLHGKPTYELIAGLAAAKAVIDQWEAAVKPSRTSSPSDLFSWGEPRHMIERIDAETDGGRKILVVATESPRRLREGPDGIRWATQAWWIGLNRLRRVPHPEWLLQSMVVSAINATTVPEEEVKKAISDAVKDLARSVTS